MGLYTSLYNILKVSMWLHASPDFNLKVSMVDIILNVFMQLLQYFKFTLWLYAALYIFT